MSELLKLYNRAKIYIINSAWVVAGLVIRSIITIFIVSKVANKIGTSDFGWYNLGISVFTLLYAVAALGLGSTFLIKHLVKDETKKEAVLGTALIARLISAAIVLFVLFLWILIFGDETEYWVLLIASGTILFQVSEVLKTYYIWKLKANVYVPISTISLCIETLFLLFGLYSDYGLFYFISVYALKKIITLLGLLWRINKDLDLRLFKFDYTILKSMMSGAWPLLLGAILTAIYARFDQILIKYFLDSKDLGIYATAIILSQIWLIIPNLIVPIIYPRIAEISAQNNKSKKYDNILLLLYGMLNYASIIVVIFMFIFGEDIIVLLYGVEYIQSAGILKVLMLNLLILFQSQLTTNVMILEGEEVYLFKAKMVSVILNISLNIILLSTYGVDFAAYSLLISAFISWFVMALFNKLMFRLVLLNFKSFLLPFYLKKVLK
jgi:O-antigen/teichoic acid export membrane protein